MHRSNAYKRLGKNDADTLAVTKRMDAMEAWRDEWEARFLAYKADVKATADMDDKRHAELVKRLGDEYLEFQVFTREANKRDGIYKNNFDEQEIMNNEIDGQIDELRTDLDNNVAKINEEMEQRTERQIAAQETIENHLNMQIEKASREIEKLKYELQDMLEHRHDNMQRKFEAENTSMRERYEVCITNVGAASESLADLFKGKMLKIKNNISR